VLAATNDGEGHSSLIILIHDVTNRVKIWGWAAVGPKKKWEMRHKTAQNAQTGTKQHKLDKFLCWHKFWGGCFLAPYFYEFVYMAAK
jgi:hypothetical protein